MYSLGDLRTRAHLSEPDAATLCGVSVSTWGRWQRTRQMPSSAYHLMEILAGQLPDYGNWHGWRAWEMHDGQLVDPSGSIFLRPADIYRFHWKQQQLKHLLRTQQQHAGKPEDYYKPTHLAQAESA